MIISARFWLLTFEAAPLHSQSKVIWPEELLLIQQFIMKFRPFVLYQPDQRYTVVLFCSHEPVPNSALCTVLVSAKPNMVYKMCRLAASNAINKSTAACTSFAPTFISSTVKYFVLL